MSREIYNLCLAWCSTLIANNAACRHSLTYMNKMKAGTSERSLVLENSCYRLRNVGERHSTPEQAIVLPSLMPELSSAQSRPSSIASAENKKRKRSGTKTFTGRERLGAINESTTQGIRQSRRQIEASQEFQGLARCLRSCHESAANIVSAPRKPDSRSEVAPGPRAQINQSITPANSEQAPAGSITVDNPSTQQINTSPVTREVYTGDKKVKKKIEYLCNLEHYIQDWIQQGKGKSRPRFGNDMHPYEIRERVRCDLYFYLLEGGELLKIEALAAYKARRGLVLPTERNPPPTCIF